MEKNNLTQNIVFKSLSNQDYVKDSKSGSILQFSDGSSRWKVITFDKVRRHVQRLYPYHPSGKLVDLINKYFLENKSEFGKERTMCFQNGYIELGTDELKKYTPKTYLVPEVKYPYIEEVQPTKFINTLDAVFEGDNYKIDTFINLFTLGLDNSISGPVICLFLGEGANGKTLLLKLIGFIYGTHKVSHLSIKEVGEKFVNWMLEGSQINISEENEPLIDKSSMKVLKGTSDGVTMNVQKKHKDSRPVFIRVAHFFAVNEMPKFSEINNAVDRRFALLKFEKVFSEEEQNRSLFEELKLEASGIFDMIHDRYKSLSKSKTPLIHQHVKDCSKVTLQNHETVSFFINNRVVISSNQSDRLLKSTLFKAYKECCTENSVKPELYQEFCKKVLQYNESISEGKTLSSTNRQRCFIGIRLKRIRKRR
jgi:P4 family phage/plasmid primase-like protien